MAGPGRYRSGKGSIRRGDSFDELNRRSSPASLPVARQGEPSWISAKAFEGRFVREIEQVGLCLSVERANTQFQAPAMLGEEPEHFGLIPLEGVQIRRCEVDCDKS